MPIPLDPRKKPADIKVRVSTGTGVDIVWADHHSSHYDFAYLREQCPCAMCDDERRKREDVAAHAGSGPGIGAGAVLPMSKVATAAAKPNARTCTNRVMMSSRVCPQCAPGWPGRQDAYLSVSLIPALRPSALQSSSVLSPAE